METEKVERRGERIVEADVCTKHVYLMSFSEKTDSFFHREKCLKYPQLILWYSANGTEEEKNVVDFLCFILRILQHATSNIFDMIHSI